MEVLSGYSQGNSFKNRYLSKDQVIGILRRCPVNTPPEFVPVGGRRGGGGNVLVKGIASSSENWN